MIRLQTNTRNGPFLAELCFTTHVCPARSIQQCTHSVEQVHQLWVTFEIHVSDQQFHDTHVIAECVCAFISSRSESEICFGAPAANDTSPHASTSTSHCMWTEVRYRFCTCIQVLFLYVQQRSVPAMAKGPSIRTARNLLSAARGVSLRLSSPGPADNCCTHTHLCTRHMCAHARRKTRHE